MTGAVVEGEVRGEEHSVRELWAGLGSVDGAAFTFAAQRSDRWQVRHGSIVFGPKEMLTSTWHDWHRSQRSVESAVDIWALYGLRSSDWVAFDRQLSTWRFVRFSLGKVEAVSLLERWFESGQIPGPTGDTLEAAIGTPTRSVLIPSFASSPMSNLVAGVGRPVQGWLQPLEDSSDEADQMPRDWNLMPGRSAFNGALHVLGMSSRQPLARGVLVGGVEHPAWIRGMRGTSKGDGHFHVSVGLDPARVAAWELVLDVEETDQAGHLLGAQRVRLADIKLPEHGVDEFTVEMNSLPGRLTRRVRLHDLSGRLLDAADDVHLLERIVVDVGLMGTTSTTPSTRIVVGEPAPAVSAHEHLEALARNAAALEDAYVQGMPQRLNIGAAQFRSRLAAARGELRVADRYFGRDDSDWDLLNAVRVPIRLLRSKYNTQPPTDLDISVRRGDHHDFHDRYYLWDAGGFHLGASASALDESASYLITVLEPSVSKYMSLRFDDWWSAASSPDAG